MKHSFVVKKWLKIIIPFSIVMMQSFSWAQQQPQKISSKQKENIVKQFSQQSTIRVLVGFTSTDIAASENTNPAHKNAERKQAIRLTQQKIQAKISQNHAIMKREFNQIPYLALEIDSTALSELEAMEEVVSIQVDELRKPTLAESIPIIGADQAWQTGVTGTGQTIAILDSGVDNTHAFLTNKVVSEACFSTTRASDGTSSLCSSGASSQTGAGAGLDCQGVEGCYHGTHVAGISAGKSDSFSGVAKDADIIAIQVFSRVDDANYCGTTAACIAAYDSDVIKGLERVYELKDTFNIAAVNLSLGSGAYSSQATCDAENGSYLAAINNLVAEDIAVVIASGNSSAKNGISSPACVSSAISVGATDDSDAIAYFTNRAPYLSYLAPGVSIKSSVPGGGFTNLQGTSMAAPHVAGAIALLSSADDSLSLSDILSALTNSGTVINDNGSSYPRIQVNDALDLLLGNTNVAEKITLTVSADNSEEVYFNGVFVGSSNNWNKATSYTLTLPEGTNVIAIKAQDSDGIAALIAQIKQDDITTDSDESWKVSTTYQDGWEQNDFDDTSWQFATSYGVYGVSPWLNKVSGLASDSTAQWIWSADNDGDNTVYFRHVIHNTTQSPPLIISDSLVAGEVNQQYNANIEVEDNSTTLVWSLISGDLPTNLLLDSGTGVISGIPTEAGEFVFDIQVTDDLNQTDTQSFTILIEEESVPIPTELSLIVAADNANEVYFNGTYLGSSTNWYKSKQYQLSLQAGTNTIAIKATDVDGIAALIAQISGDNWSATSDASWVVSTEYQENWTTTAFDDANWKNAAEYGAYGVQPWNKKVSGLPTNSTAQWIWSDDNENDDIAYFRFTIESAAQTAPIEFLSADLSAGQVNSAYNDSITISGGEAPYIWNVKSGNLPDGLTLNQSTGDISGIPTSAGTFNFVIEVTDSVATSSSQNFEIVITAVEPVILNILLTADNVSQAYFNGVLLGSSDNWKNSTSYNVELQTGENVVSVKASDVDGVAAFIAQLVWNDSTQTSNENWKVITNAEAGWQNIGFDDSHWEQATSFGAYGSSPWLYNVKNFPTDSGAQWIWSSDNLNDDEVYFRFVINL